MMVAVRASEERGIRAGYLIEKNLGWKVNCYIEPLKLSKVRHCEGDIPIVSQYKIIDYYKRGIIEKIVIPGNLKPRSLLEIQEEYKQFDVSDSDVIVIPVHLMTKDIWTENDCNYVMNNHRFPYLEYLEFHIADHCNLNCKNCTHFSPYVKNAVFADFAEVRSDLMRLRKLIDNIGVIRILGGECLLNSEIGNYITMVKEIFPFTALSIVTNGLLVRSISEDLIEIIKNNRVTVDLSVYPPLFSQIDSITDFLEKAGVMYSILGPIFCFSKCIDIEHKVPFPFDTTQGQWGCGCYNLYKGRIAICPMVCFADYYDDHFKTNGIVAELSQDGVIEIDKIENFDELSRFLKAPCRLCDYCTFYRSRYDDNLKIKWERFF